MQGLKTGGRQQGTPNKITSDLRETLNEIILNEISNLKELLNTLPTEKRLDYLIKLMPYIIPKLNNIELSSANNNTDNENYPPMTETEIDNLMNKWCEMRDFTVTKRLD